jgi:hypothetical protein
MLHFYEDSRLLQAESVGRREDVEPSIGSRRRHAGLVSHRTQKTSNEVLHLLPVKSVDSVFDELIRFCDLLSKPLLVSANGDALGILYRGLTSRGFERTCVSKYISAASLTRITV